jgi:hypothetical protein
MTTVETLSQDRASRQVQRTGILTEISLGVKQVGGAPLQIGLLLPAIAERKNEHHLGGEPGGYLAC